MTYDELMDYLHPNRKKVQTYNVFGIGKNDSAIPSTIELTNEELYNIGIESSSKFGSLTAEQMKKLNDTQPVSFSSHTDMFTEMLRKPLRVFNHVTI